MSLDDVAVFIIALILNIILKSFIGIFKARETTAGHILSRFIIDGW